MLHLVVEINQALIKGLVDTWVFMSIMATNIVRELVIMHLVAGHETYMTTSSIVIDALGRALFCYNIDGRMHYLVVHLKHSQVTSKFL
jgi:hypothetical protein